MTTREPESASASRAAQTARVLTAADPPALVTDHRVVVGDARALLGSDAIADGAVDLVITSPPYPMVGMWDAAFRGLSAAAGRHLDAGDGPAAWEAMHEELDRVWAGCARALAPGGFLCVNVGDAVRTIAGEFRLYPNHARVTASALRLGLAPLPDILWRKPTNAPTKFMGSGMLPCGAYVTYEHEYILIFRKGGKRGFDRAEDKARRARSAYFWEERNAWFSDLWTDLRGEAQGLDGALGAARERSAAFPFELAYRLACMYAVEGDLILDPFAGTGTTMLAAACAGRRSVGVELDPALAPAIEAQLARAVEVGHARAGERLAAHRAFLDLRRRAGLPLKHWNDGYGFPVMTSQERLLRLLQPRAVRRLGPGRFEVEHALERSRPLGLAAPAPPGASGAPTGARERSLFEGD